MSETQEVPVFISREEIYGDNGGLEQFDIIFDVRFNAEDPNTYGRRQYIAGRIPGSYFVNMDEELSDKIILAVEGGATPAGDPAPDSAVSPTSPPPDSHGIDSTPITGRHPLPPIARFVAWCRHYGLLTPHEDGSKKKILLYDDQCGAACGRLWWMLRSLDIPSRILNGGYQGYYLEPLPCATSDVFAPVEAGEEKARMLHGSPLPAPTAEDATPGKYSWSHTINFATAEAIIAANEQAKAAGGDQQQIPLVDARFAPRYNSAVRPVAADKVAGYIPSSANRPWNSNCVSREAAATAGRTYNGTTSYLVLKPFAQLKEELLAFASPAGGEKPLTNSVFTCASGVTTSISLATSTAVGLGTPFLYPGAYSQYEAIRRAKLESVALWGKGPEGNQEGNYGYVMRLTTRGPLPGPPGGVSLSSKLTSSSSALPNITVGGLPLSPVAPLPKTLPPASSLPLTINDASENDAVIMTELMSLFGLSDLVDKLVAEGKVKVVGHDADAEEEPLKEIMASRVASAVGASFLLANVGDVYTLVVAAAPVKSDSHQRLLIEVAITPAS